jgi:hypothetical protein
MNFVTKPVGNPLYISAPFCFSRQDDLSTETVKCLEKNDLMTTQRAYSCCLQTSWATTNDYHAFEFVRGWYSVWKGFLTSG